MDRFDPLSPEALCPDIGSSLISYTNNNRHVAYQMGARTVSDGRIDCSGWAAEATLAAMGQINNLYEKPLYDMNQASSLLKAAAAPQIERVSKITGLISEKDLHAENLHSGTLVGIRRKTGGEWAHSRWNRISHIVIFARCHQGAFISQSASGLGVHLRPYSEWLKDEVDMQSEFYATNPFKLVAENAGLAWKLNDTLALRQAYKDNAALAARILPEYVRISRFDEDKKYVELLIVRGNSCHYYTGKYMFQTPRQLALRYESCNPI